ncbi:MAG: hypothetical protein DMG50_30160 [Acidobacteria bacterium]|nr:MAG: hypothetical protein DMG50_30160 [Acidobacteriota bacterium]
MFVKRGLKKFDEIEAVAGKNRSLRIDAVRLARFVVAGVAATSDVDDSGGNGGGERSSQGVRSYIGGVGVLNTVLGPAIFKAITDEALGVISDAEQFALA